MTIFFSTNFDILTIRVTFISTKYCLQFFQVSDPSILGIYKRMKLILWNLVEKWWHPVIHKVVLLTKMWRKVLQGRLFKIMRKPTSTYLVCNLLIAAWLFSAALSDYSQQLASFGTQSAHSISIPVLWNQWPQVLLGARNF